MAIIKISREIRQLKIDENTDSEILNFYGLNSWEAIVELSSYIYDKIPHTFLRGELLHIGLQVNRARSYKEA
jgi:hypothetical protein